MTQPPLNPKSLATYPPEGRAMALQFLSTLQQMPVCIAPSFLADLQEYDFRFPVEQTQIRKRLEALERRPDFLRPFAAISIPPILTKNRNWIDQPRIFLQALTAHLWSSGQMDAFRAASMQLVARIDVNPSGSSEQPRLLIVLIGKDARRMDDYPLFMHLRSKGRLFTAIDGGGDVKTVISEVIGRRRKAVPDDYAHWYIDGGSGGFLGPAEGIVQVSYAASDPVRQRVLMVMRDAIQAGIGPRLLRDALAELGSAGIKDAFAADQRMSRFVTNIFTDGAGTQIFSTSFVQWAAREALQRAQPQTMLVRFSPRQKQSAFNKMLTASSSAPTDPEGSLIDGDMAAWSLYSQFIHLRSPAGARTVVWAENAGTGVVCGEHFAAGTKSYAPVTLSELISV